MGAAQTNAMTSPRDVDATGKIYQHLKHRYIRPFMCRCSSSKKEKPRRLTMRTSRKSAVVGSHCASNTFLGRSGVLRRAESGESSRPDPRGRENSRPDMSAQGGKEYKY